MVILPSLIVPWRFVPSRKRWRCFQVKFHALSKQCIDGTALYETWHEPIINTFLARKDFWNEFSCVLHLTTLHECLTSSHEEVRELATKLYRFFKENENGSL